MAYPRRLLGPDEEVLKEFRPHWVMLVGPVALAVVAAAGMVVVALTMSGPGSWAAVAGIVVVWLVLVARRLADWLTTRYVITNERVIYRAGVFSRRGKEIPLEVINDVAFSQTFVERMLRSGDLLIESAGEMGQSRYQSVPDPEGLQSLIYQVRELRTVALRGDDRSVGSELEALVRLRDRGVLSESEFEAQKRRLLGAGEQG